MNCNDVRMVLPLLGQDLEPQAEQSVRRHLAVCPLCREQSARLNQSAAVLRMVAAQAPTELYGDECYASNWPQIRRQLAVRERVADPRVGWIPVGLMAAACVAVMMLSSSTPVFRFEQGDQFAGYSEFGTQPGYDPDHFDAGVMSPSFEAEYEEWTPFGRRSLLHRAGNPVDTDFPLQQPLPQADWNLRSF